MTDFHEIPYDFIKRNLTQVQKRTLKKKHLIKLTIDQRPGDKRPMYEVLSEQTGMTPDSIRVYYSRVSGPLLDPKYKDVKIWLTSPAYTLTREFTAANLTAYQKGTIEIKHYIRQRMDSCTGNNIELFDELSDELNMSYGSIALYAYVKIQ